VGARVQRSALVVEAHLVDDRREALNQCPVPCLARRQLAFGLDPIRDVDQHTAPVESVPISVADQDGMVVHPDLGAVGTEMPELSVERGTLTHRDLPRIEHAGQVVGVDHLDPVGACLFEEAHRVSEDLLDVRTDVQGVGDRLVGIDVEHRGEMLDDRAHVRFGI
jgi:hypothetical protein